MFPLQHRDCGPVSAQLIGHRVLLLQDSGEDLLAVVEILVELPAGLKHLVPGVNQLPKVGPGVVEGVLPLGDGRGVCVAHTDQAVGNLIDSGHPLAADGSSVLGELLKSLGKKCDVLVILAELVRSGHHLSLGNPLLQVVNLTVEHEQLVQLGSPLGGQVLQPGVELVHLTDPDVDGLTVWMLLGYQLPGRLPKLSDGGSKVLHRCLQYIVLLHQILSAEFVLTPVLDHHVKLLLAHPRLRLVGVIKELLDLLGRQQLLLPLVHELLEPGPLIGQVPHVSVVLLRLRMALTDHLVAALHHKVDSLLMIVDLLLQHFVFLEK